jgi:hypothetical protein
VEELMSNIDDGEDQGSAAEAFLLDKGISR